MHEIIQKIIVHAIKLIGSILLRANQGLLILRNLQGLAVPLHVSI